MHLQPESREGWRKAKRQMANVRMAREAGAEKLKQDPEDEEARQVLAFAAELENAARLRTYNTACGTLMFAATSETSRDRRGESEAAGQLENSARPGWAVKGALGYPGELPGRTLPILLVPTWWLDPRPSSFGTGPAACSTTWRAPTPSRRGRTFFTLEHPPARLTLRRFLAHQPGRAKRHVPPHGKECDDEASLRDRCSLAGNMRAGLRRSRRRRTRADAARQGIQYGPRQRGHRCPGARPARGLRPYPMGRHRRAAGAVSGQSQSATRSVGIADRRRHQSAPPRRYRRRDRSQHRQGPK